MRIRNTAVAIALLSLAGCTTGDFGQPRSSAFIKDDVHDWVAYDATAGISPTPSRFDLTDDERQLRDLSYPLIEWPYNRNQWYSAAGELGVIGSNHRAYYDPGEYTTFLMAERHRSPSSRYAQLLDDIRNDIARLPQFFETAARVSDMDRKRGKSLAYIPASANERDQAQRRIRDNQAVIRYVQSSLDRRVNSYRFAMERLVLMTPSSDAVEIERSLNALRAQIAYYRAGAPMGRSPQAGAIAR